MSGQQRQTARERAEATLERVGSLLAMPRAQGEPWRLPDPEPTRSTREPVEQSPAPASPVSRKWVRGIVDQAVEAMTAATARFTSQQLNVQRLRIVEIERRVAALEAQLEESKR